MYRWRIAAHGPILLGTERCLDDDGVITLPRDAVLMTLRAGEDVMDVNGLGKIADLIITLHR